ncbi:MAG: hypothetical protein WCI87_09645 [Euryarchaeota archaeon]
MSVTLADFDTPEPLPFPEVDNDLEQHILNICMTLTDMVNNEEDNPPKKRKRIRPQLLVRRLAGTRNDVKRILLAMYSRDVVTRTAVNTLTDDFPSYIKGETR